MADIIINPLMLVIISALALIMPLDRGLDGAEIRSVSNWKQSVKACPNP